MKAAQVDDFQARLLLAHKSLASTQLRHGTMVVDEERELEEEEEEDIVRSISNDVVSSALKAAMFKLQAMQGKKAQKINHSTTST